MVEKHLEVLPASAVQTVVGADPLRWPDGSITSASIDTSIDWALSTFVTASAEARDLFRVAAAIYLADSRVSKPAVSLHRDLHVTVHVEGSDAWSDATRELVADLAHWLTGDHWTIDVTQSASRPTTTQIQRLPLDRVQLLSGGLDSLCGAVIGLRDDLHVRFVGARDYSNAVRHAQNVIREAIGARAVYSLEHVLLSTAAERLNHGPRSRALMYMALGVLYADSEGAGSVWVPENGFTSINPPLDPGRGGTLTTRSTHPMTFVMVNRLVRALDIQTMVTNPFASLTKGELVEVASAELASANWFESTRSSYSCGAGKGHLYGYPNLNCGLCVACVVRRGSFIRAGITDPTRYVVDVAEEAKKAWLIRDRGADLDSLRDVVDDGVDNELVLANGSWPSGTDFDEVLALVVRGVEELRAVPLPSA
ncbi:hypothetical protein [Microbacterium oleivorans]|uniref:7-cyano-7-deazaguanine synthase n=1 Tax=Microbacterium oleivorans TaxID=273677 RepID=A0A4R5YIA1_9MICO|nr:hypothetical protein [Microbacterium oleivorans]TDL45044.1 hypothetical protein E2R54_00705 [Microbacterium oleivorans]